MTDRLAKAASICVVHTCCNLASISLLKKGENMKGVYLLISHALSIMCLDSLLGHGDVQ